jgi:hypothetical protein
VLAESKRPLHWRITEALYNTVEHLAISRENELYYMAALGGSAHFNGNEPKKFYEKLTTAIDRVEIYTPYVGVGRILVKEAPESEEVLQERELISSELAKFQAELDAKNAETRAKLEEHNRQQQEELKNTIAREVSSVVESEIERFKKEWAARRNPRNTV